MKERISFGFNAFFAELDIYQIHLAPDNLVGFCHPVPAFMVTGLCLRAMGVVRFAFISIMAHLVFPTMLPVT